MWNRFCTWVDELWQDLLCTIGWHHWEEVRWGCNQCKNCDAVDETEIY